MRDAARSKGRAAGGGSRRSRRRGGENLILLWAVGDGKATLAPPYYDSAIVGVAQHLDLAVTGQH